MAFDKEITYFKNPDGPDEVIDEPESGNSFLALREVKWKEEAPFKLDIRKYFVKPDGTEVFGKGISFMTEDGPSNLIKSLVNIGFGDCREIIKTIQENRHNDLIDALGYAYQYLSDEEYKGEIDLISKSREEHQKRQTTSAIDMLDKLM